MSFLTFCFQIKITPRRRRQRCRLILLKRQIKRRGFQKCNQKIFWHTGMHLNCLPKRHFETFRTEEVIFFSIICQSLIIFSKIYHLQKRYGYDMMKLLKWDIISDRISLKMPRYNIISYITQWDIISDIYHCWYISLTIL